MVRAPCSAPTDRIVFGAGRFFVILLELLPSPARAALSSAPEVPSCWPLHGYYGDLGRTAAPMAGVGRPTVPGLPYSAARGTGTSSASSIMRSR